MIKRFFSGRALLLSILEGMILLYILLFTWGLPGHFVPEAIPKAASYSDHVYACQDLLPLGSSSYCSLSALAVHAVWNSFEASIFYFILLLAIPVGIVTNPGQAFKDFIYGPGVIGTWTFILTPLLIFLVLYFLNFVALKYIERKK